MNFRKHKKQDRKRRCGKELCKKSKWGSASDSRSGDRKPPKRVSNVPGHRLIMVVLAGEFYSKVENALNELC